MPYQVKDPPSESSPNTLIIPADWALYVRQVAAEGVESSRSFLICGPKGSGKSTFAKFLVNSILSQQQDFTESQGVAFLDLDPGQPEFQPPGSVSLMLLRSFVMSAHFTHDITSVSSKITIVRSHFLGTLTPRDDPLHYLECCLDLLNAYRNFQGPNTSANAATPLVINCCGWILGTGLDILADLISRALPSHIIYMSTLGPEEVESRLATMVPTLSNSFHTLASQPFQLATKDSSEMRLVKMLSYFHQRASSDGLLGWKFPPLQLSELLSLQYAGENQLIHGVVISGDETNLNCVAELVENSVLGIVLVDSAHPSEENDLYSRSSISTAAGNEHSACSTWEPYTDVDNLSNHHTKQSKATRNGPCRIARTLEQIPCLRLSADGQLPFETNKIQCVGQVLICKVNQDTCSFEVVTPIPRRIFDHWCKVGLNIVLVRAQLDIPAWTSCEQVATNLVKSVFFQPTMTDDKLHENLIDEDGESTQCSMYVLDSLDHESSRIGITRATSTTRFETKVWRSRKNLRYFGLSDNQTAMP